MALADDIAKGLMAAGKVLYREKIQRERDAVRAERRRASAWLADTEWTRKDAVFIVLPEAVAAASGDGAYTVPARTLYYQVRPRIQEYTDKELEYGYFSQTLLVEYQRKNGPIAGLTREARGALREPHTGHELPLGTLEVAEYRFPAFVFDKVLYIEKQGLDPIWETAHLAERYDMALASGKGQPVEAVRDLFARAEAGEYRLFVLHDADHSGYSIARTIAEATARMPDHSVQVIDLGLTVAEAIEQGLPREFYTRKVALPWWMPSRLTDQEKEWFQGEHLQGKQWKCTRVELNAFSAPELVAYVEAALERNGAADKLMPPENVLAAETAQVQRGLLEQWAANRLAEMFDLPRLVAALSSGHPEMTEGPEGWIETAYDRDRASYWRTVVAETVRHHLENLDGPLREQLSELIDEQE